MDNWKNLLYESYVASGQALAGGRDSLPAHALDPYFQQLVSRHLAPDRELAIADVACGHGALLSCLKEAGYRVDRHAIPPGRPSRNSTTDGPRV